MVMVQVVPGLMGAVVGVLFSVLVWGIWNMRGRPFSTAVLEAQTNLLLCLLVLAAFVLGACLTYVLLRL